MVPAVRSGTAMMDKFKTNRAFHLTQSTHTPASAKAQTASEQ